MLKENVLKSFNGKRALVTGGTGMIGRQVVDILSDAGADVAVVLKPVNYHNLFNLKVQEILCKPHF